LWPQLRLDGSAVAQQRPGGALSPAQRDILRYMREHDGEISSTRAGVIVHACRASGCSSGPSAASDRWTPGERGEACCPWAASDGGECMKRLARRGLVYHAGPGCWRLWARVLGS